MTGLPPKLREPTVAEIKRYADRHNLSLSDEAARDYRDMIASKTGVLEALDGFDAPSPRVTHTDREQGERRDDSADPFNAFVRRCTVRGADEGILAGDDVAVKDNIAVANVELTAASKVLKGYIPEFDATVVEAVLDAGGTIVGKTNLDEFAVSGSGELSATGPIRNPRDDDYLAGGSSGGSAVAVVTGDADIALGTDQAGSLRTPASWCGCVGYKPTYGLVPYTGCLSGGPTYDHVGPIARTVADCARAMDAMTVEDPLDHRQRAVEFDDYSAGLTGDPSDLTVGVLEEGFAVESMAPDVGATVEEALTAFETEGAELREVSVPWHSDGILVWLGIAWGESAALLRDNGVGYYMDGYYSLGYLTEFAKSRTARADDFAPTVKLKLLLGEFLREVYDGYYHAKAQNLRRDLRAAYDAALTDVDVLAMPTTPTTAFKYESDLTRTEIVERAQGKDGRTTNTMPFDVTGHPALSVPCGTDDDGLPVGLMLVGNRFDDVTVLAAGHAFEEATGLADL